MNPLSRIDQAPASTIPTPTRDDDRMSRLEQERALEDRRKAVLDKVERYAHITFDELHAASRRETEALLMGAQKIQLDEQEISSWETYVDGTMQDQIVSARMLYNNLIDPLLTAYQDKAISDRVLNKKIADFQDENTDYKVKEKYVKDVLPERLKEWNEVKEKRDLLVKKPSMKLLRKGHVEHYEALFDADAFAKLPYPDRKKLVEKAAAIVSAREHRTEHLMKEVRTLLTGYKYEGILHHSKVSTWVERIFVRNRSVEEVQKYIEETVEPNAERWRQVRADFDTLNEEMKKEGIPRGFQPIKKDAFLKMEYKQRTSYCALGWLQLEDPVGLNEQNKMLAAHKMRIRYCLNAGDWEEAEEQLTQAKTLAPDDYELASMQNYLHSHRLREEAQEDENDSDPQTILQEMRELVGVINSPSLRELYEKALAEGPSVFNRLAQIMYNRVWLYEVAHWTPQEEERRLTLQRLNGHQASKANLIDLEERSVQGILHDVREHADVNAGKGPPNLSADEHWGYWSSLRSSLDIAEHSRIVRHLNYPLKQKARKMKSLGFAYTSLGPPQSLN